jgi:hypothetical protein
MRTVTKAVVVTILFTIVSACGVDTEPGSEADRSSDVSQSVATPEGATKRGDAGFTPTSDPFGAEPNIGVGQLSCFAGCLGASVSGTCATGCILCAASPGIICVAQCAVCAGPDGLKCARQCL